MKRILAIVVLLAAAGGALWLRPGLTSLPLAELERRHATPDSKFADVAGVRMHYMDQGRGEPVVLIHASFMNLRTWDSMAKTLSQKYRVIRMDMPNSGLTGADPRDDYRMEHYVELVTGLLDQLGVQRFALLGTSSGGIVAFRLAGTHPDRVQRLVLINSAGMPRTAATNPNRPRGNALTRWIAANYVSRDQIRANLAQNFVPPHQPPEWLVELNYDLYRREDRQRTGALAMKQFQTGDPEAMLAKVQAPTLILWGLENATVMHLEADVFQHWLTAAPTFKKKYPGLGHYPYLEEPALVEGDVTAFLAGELDGELRYRRIEPYLPAATPTPTPPTS